MFFHFENPVFRYISRELYFTFSLLIPLCFTKYSFLFLPLLLLAPSNSVCVCSACVWSCTLEWLQDSISRYLWVDDSVVGVWVGACIVALIIMTNAYLEKKNIRFRFRDTIIALSYVIFSCVSLCGSYRTVSKCISEIDEHFPRQDSRKFCNRWGSAHRNAASVSIPQSP